VKAENKKNLPQNPNRERFSTEEIKNISALGDIIREIRSRLLREGVSIDDERKKLLIKIRNSG